MKRLIPLLLLALLALSACGGGAADTTVPEPPKSKAFEQSDSAKVNQIVSGWKDAVPAEMKAQSVKPETIEEKTYQSSASLKEVADFYAQLKTKGWTEAARMPGVQANDGVLLLGFESGNTDLVIGAVDAAKYGGNGVVVYTAKGTR